MILKPPQLSAKRKMSDKRRQRRGRPKGSGIDDWKRLLEIAEAMERDPKLRVTTAIKQLGFNDPSIIRRLRDKFKVNSDVLLSRTKKEHKGNILSEKSVSHIRGGKHRKNVSYREKEEARRNNSHRIPPKKHHYKRAQDALAEYAHIAESPVSFVSGFQASIAHCLLQQTQDHGLEY